jgi:hypothetical protein
VAGGTVDDGRVGNVFAVVYRQGRLVRILLFFFSALEGGETYG